MPVPGWGEAGERRCARGEVVREGEAKRRKGSRDRKKKWEGDGWGTEAWNQEVAQGR